MWDVELVGLYERLLDSGKLISFRIFHVLKFCTYFINITINQINVFKNLYMIIIFLSFSFASLLRSGLLGSGVFYKSWSSFSMSQDMAASCYCCCCSYCLGGSTSLLTCSKCYITVYSSFMIWYRNCSYHGIFILIFQTILISSYFNLLWKVLYKIDALGWSMLPKANLTRTWSNIYIVKIY